MLISCRLYGNRNGVKDWKLRETADLVISNIFKTPSKLPTCPTHLKWLKNYFSSGENCISKGLLKITDDVLHPVKSTLTPLFLLKHMYMQKKKKEGSVWEFSCGILFIPSIISRWSLTIRKRNEATHSHTLSLRTNTHSVEITHRKRVDLDTI